MKFERFKVNLIVASLLIAPMVGFALVMSLMSITFGREVFVSNAVPFAYMIGIIPALLGAAILLKSLSGWESPPFRNVVKRAFASGFFVMLAVGMFIPGDTALEAIGMMLVSAMIGGVSGTTTAAVAYFYTVWTADYPG